MNYLDEANSNNSPDSHQDPDANLLHLELARVLRRGLSELPANQREVLILLSDEQLRSYCEIGKMLAMPIGSIGPTRSRGLVRLRATAAVHDYIAGADGAQHQQSA